VPKIHQAWFKPVIKAICRALVQRPQIILADEPIASLDPRNTQMVMDALRTINQEMGITVLCNLHDLDLARDYCGRLIGMAAGKVVFDGTPDQLTPDAVKTLYGIEANEVLQEAPGLNLHPAPILSTLPSAQVH
jgi:phosphonate transport system ATP-binding protein